LEWQNQRLKTLPKAVEDATKEYRLEQDIFGRFLSQTCVCGRVCTAMSSALYSAYESWLKTQDETGKEKPISATAFGLLLRKRGFKKVPTAQGIRWDGVGLASEI
jgi:putative DNA primase/helicase